MKIQEVFLRPEQKKFNRRIYDAFASYNSVLGVYPTGGGKTYCFSDIIRAHDGGALVTTHRKKIIIQISRSLAIFGVKHRVIAPTHILRSARRSHLKTLNRSYIDQNARVGVASVQTLTSKSNQKNRALQRWISKVSLAVFDEGHHYVRSGQWAASITSLPVGVKKLFVTATPERCDGKGLGVDYDGFIETMVEGPPVKWQIENGRLCDYRYVAPKTDLDVSDIPVTASGDFNRNKFRQKVVESSLVGSLVEHYERFALGLKTIIFVTDVSTAKDVEAAFIARGHVAKELNADTPIAKSDKTLDDYERGRVTILINVDLFDEGFDVPNTEAVILARPTMSLGKFLQQCGRVLRTADGKDKATIVDCVRNWERHGLPDWPRAWSLAGREKRSNGGGGDKIKLRVCIECTQPYEAFYKKCPYCGYVSTPTGRAKPEQVDGDLFELDKEALGAIFEAIHKADAPSDAYRRELIRKGCPTIGVERNVRIHEASKRRREVLRNLVSWWIGAQADRQMSEVYRRFYFTFGVDIGTAFTLKLNDTDALIDKMTKRYTEDLV